MDIPSNDDIPNTVRPGLVGRLAAIDWPSPNADEARTVS